MIHLKRTGQWTDEPVDRKIFGSFVESGFGRQVSGMWSEMLYNRSFRQIPPYQPPTWEWLGVDADHYDARAPFWHSGYEEHNWTAFGQVTAKRSLGTRTYKGSTSLVVENTGNAPGGLRQEGIRLEQGREYVFTMTAGINGTLNDIGLNGFGNPDFSPQVYPIDVRIGKNNTRLQVTMATRKFQWAFTAMETECAEIVISILGQCALALSCTSLMPADNIDGWRGDVVECIRQAAPRVIRFPGGCFASFYNWEDTVGPRDEREPQPSYYWGGLEENDVGVDEFMRLSELAGFEAQFCVNMMTSNPFRARQLVEYLNAPENVGMGRLRKLNGRAKPYGVRLFEMDNEPGRKWTAEQYAAQCVRFAREMRLADPDIELMMAAYSYPKAALRDMLEICGGEIQYVIYREGTPEFVHDVLEILRDYNRCAGTSIRLANTEWLPPCHSVEPFEDPEVPVDFRWRGVITNDYRKVFSTQQRSWNYALNGAHRLLDYMSYGGEFALANFNNLCNTWGQNLIEASADEAWLSCMGEVFAFFRRHFQPCVAQTVETDEREECMVTAHTDAGESVQVKTGKIFALVARSDGSEQLYVINHGSKPVEIELPGEDWTHRETLAGKSRLGGNAASERVVQTVLPSQQGSSAILPGLSLSVYERKNATNHSVQ